MLAPRIIPCLLIRDHGLIKTIKFDESKYIGDPINAVKIFNEKLADEIIILDIDATKNNKEPNYQMISDLAAECRMPLCYGGGVKNLDNIKKIIELGAEKVSINAAAVEDPELITRAADLVGSQSIVVVMDIKKKLFSKYQQYIYNGTKPVNTDIVSFAKKVASLGAGEIVINSIDQDGTMEGYDFKLIELIKNQVNIPVTALGGASSLENISDLVGKFGIIGAAAGSLFVFKGKYRAVLINYPAQSDKYNLFNTEDK
jgi:imidazole glycerol-phosphate synthase subunit HisF